MSTASLTALVTAITGLVAAVATLAGVIRHVTGPSHQDPVAPDEPPPSSPGLAGPPSADVKVIPPGT